MSDYNWREHWQDKYRDGTPVEDVCLLPSEGITGSAIVAKRAGIWSVRDKNGCVWNHCSDKSDLLPLPKPKVLRPYRDLEEFAAAVWRDMPKLLQDSLTPGMCLALVWARENAGGWHPLGVGAVNWQWRLDSGMEWTIDPLDPVGRPFGVEE